MANRLPRHLRDALFTDLIYHPATPLTGVYPAYDQFGIDPQRQCRGCGSFHRKRHQQRHVHNTPCDWVIKMVAAMVGGGPAALLQEEEEEEEALSEEEEEEEEEVEGEGDWMDVDGGDDEDANGGAFFGDASSEEGRGDAAGSPGVVRRHEDEQGEDDDGDEYHDCSSDDGAGSYCTASDSSGDEEGEEEGEGEEWQWEEGEEEEEEEEEEEPSASGHSADYKHYLQRLDKPLFDGATKTLRQFLWGMLFEKRRGSVRDAAFTNMMWCMSDTLPNSGCLPSTMYMIRKLLGVEDIYSVERHACKNGCGVWPHTPKKKWHLHEDDKCAVCQGPRFRKKLRVSSRRWQCLVGGDAPPPTSHTRHITHLLTLTPPAPPNRSLASHLC